MKHRNAIMANVLTWTFAIVFLTACRPASSARVQAEVTTQTGETAAEVVLGYPFDSTATYATCEVWKNMPAFYEQARESLTYPLAWRNAGIRRFERWKKTARQTVWDCMGQLPKPASDYEVKVVCREQREGYTALKIVFNLSDFSRIPAYLLVPDGEGPFPALLALHDHGAHFDIGKEKMIRPILEGKDTRADSLVLADALRWSVACYDSVFTGDYFARHGYVVLSTDALLWGERGRREGPLYETQQALSSNLLQLGMNWCGLITFDDIQSVEFLASLPFVDTQRIGAYGHSMGAHRAWMLSALSDRVKACTAVCWMNTTDHLMTLSNNQNKGGSAYSMLLPDLRRYLDYPDVASLACPKPMYFMNGRRDKLFPVQGVEDAYALMRDVWTSQGAGNALRCELVEGPHFFSRDMQEKALSFFDEFLGD